MSLGFHFSILWKSDLRGFAACTGLSRVNFKLLNNCEKFFFKKYLGCAPLREFTQLPEVTAKATAYAKHLAPRRLGEFPCSVVGSL